MTLGICLALILSSLAGAILMAYIFFRSHTLDPKMRLLSDLMGHSSSRPPKHRHVHAR